jgi:hypothetical protein
MITFDDITITPSSTGSVLILSSSNTLKYIKADKTKVIIENNKYVSPIFEI